MENGGDDYGPETGKAPKRSLLIQNHTPIAYHVETIRKTAAQTCYPNNGCQTHHTPAAVSIPSTALDDRSSPQITAIIEQALEEQQVCATMFLDVAQAFVTVWHSGLLHKIEQILPTQHSQLLKSYLSVRYFRVKQGKEYSELKPVKAGVPQGSVLGPVLYLIFTSDIPQPTGTTVATFANDTAILAVGADVEAATQKLHTSG